MKKAKNTDLTVDDTVDKQTEAGTASDTDVTEQTDYMKTGVYLICLKLTAADTVDKLVKKIYWPFNRLYFAYCMCGHSPHELNRDELSNLTVLSLNCSATGKEQRQGHCEALPVVLEWTRHCHF